MPFIQWLDIEFQIILHFDGLVQERRNSSALAMELRLSCTNPAIYYVDAVRSLRF